MHSEREVVQTLCPPDIVFANVEREGRKSDDMTLCGFVYVRLHSRGINRSVGQSRAVYIEGVFGCSADAIENKGVA